MGYLRPPQATRLTAASYKQGCLDELVDVICQFSLYSSQSHTVSPEQKISTLQAYFAHVFPVVAFLVDCQYDLDRDTQWREFAQESFTELVVGIMGKSVDVPPAAQDVLMQHSFDIAAELVNQFTTFVVDAIHSCYQEDNFDPYTLVMTMKISDIATLMNNSCALTQYVRDPRKRIYLHGEYLSPFHMRRVKDGDDTREVAYGWHYENVASFGYSLMAAMSRRENLDRINNLLFDLSKFYMRPVLDVLFERLGDVVQDIDALLGQLLLDSGPNRPYSRRMGPTIPHPFVTIVDRWLSGISTSTNKSAVLPVNVLQIEALAREPFNSLFRSVN